MLRARQAGPAMDDVPITPSARRINALAAALGARRYLEIGVNEGATFRAVRCPERSGVDPQFLFDPASLADRNTRLYAMPSDRFFARLPFERRFDIVFIDGLHRFEQAYRDLMNALLHAHDRTVFLIDDTLPSDVYSALPDQQAALAARRAAGGSNLDWHGDVYKVVAAIHDLHPGLDYRTIRDGPDNPQTLVWRSKAGGRQPRFPGFEAIARLGYFDLLDDLGLLRPATEQAAIAACLAGLPAGTGCP